MNHRESPDPSKTETSCFDTGRKRFSGSPGCVECLKAPHGLVRSCEIGSGCISIPHHSGEWTPEIEELTI